MSRLTVALVCAAVAVTACADPGEPAADPTGIAWELTSGTVEGTALPVFDSHPITLSFTDDGAGGTAACNGYGGSYSISGTEVSFAQLMWTEMACMPEEVMESERLYLEALPRVETFSMTNDGLTLSGDGVELAYVALPPLPTSELTGTVWVLDSLIMGDAVSSVMGERATLELFTDGSMLGSTGCRTLSGNYTVSGAEVVMTEMSAQGECPAKLEDQDSHVTSVVGGGFRGTIEGDTLTLTASGDHGLVYRAES
jgi:heat shock protein HslJ